MIMKGYLGSATTRTRAATRWPRAGTRSLPPARAAGQYMGELPAPLTPLGEMRSLRAQRGVVSVAGVHHGVVVETVEDLTFKIVHQGCEVFGIVGFARTPREETVPGEQMSDASTRIRERDRTWRVPNQPNHFEPLCAQFDL